MERIGIAASKMAKGKLWVYNLWVIFISFIFSLLIFFIAGSSIVLALIIIGYIVSGIIPSNLSGEWGRIVKICMIFLTVVVGLVNLYAIGRNIKVAKDKDLQ